MQRDYFIVGLYGRQRHRKHPKGLPGRCGPPRCRNQIKSIAENAGAFVPWLRPNELSTDKAPVADAAIHALDWYEKVYGKVDGLLVLQPSSPFRKKQTIEKGIKLFTKFKLSTIIGVSSTHQHPQWAFTIKNGILEPFLKKNRLMKINPTKVILISGKALPVIRERGKIKINKYFIFIN